MQFCDHSAPSGTALNCERLAYVRISILTRMRANLKVTYCLCMCVCIHIHGRPRVRFLVRSLQFSNWLNLSSRIMDQGPTQLKTESEPGIFLGGRSVRLTTLAPSMSRLSSQCGILTISRPYRPLTEKAFTSLI
jgi:hypothetical protein